MTKIKAFRWVLNPTTNQKEYIEASDIFVLNDKIAKKKEAWEKQAIKKQAEIEKLNKLLDKYATQNKCERQNETLRKLNLEYEMLLKDNDKNGNIFSWSRLKSHLTFQVSKPELNYKPIQVIKFLGLFPLNKVKIESENLANLQKANQILEEELQIWSNEKESFEEAKNAYNTSIDKIAVSYSLGLSDAVEFYNLKVLEQLTYPEELDLEYKIAYNLESKILLVEMELPPKSKINQTAQYKYITKDNQISEIPLSPKQINENYNLLIHKIVLRAISKICNLDSQDHIELVVINGWVMGIDSATGHSFRNCILSIQVSKSEFLELLIDKIDPISCFKRLKGISSGQFADLVPIKPIMKIDTVDKRIIEAESVIENYTSDQNLASMPWEDFEVLIRDLFKKEFSSDSCTIEVTQASRDAGVDALVFDQDPIRGGKYVIQAKRYNNVVGVSAVRDLYGTMMNEGAVKGILVTTSYFGADSYQFVKGKPLTLISGQELIGLFNKHSYQVRINLKERVTT